MYSSHINFLTDATPSQQDPYQTSDNDWGHGCVLNPCDKICSLYALMWPVLIFLPSGAAAHLRARINDRSFRTHIRQEQGSPKGTTLGPYPPMSHLWSSISSSSPRLIPCSVMGHIFTLLAKETRDSTTFIFDSICSQRYSNI